MENNTMLRVEFRLRDGRLVIMRGDPFALYAKAVNCPDEKVRAAICRISKERAVPAPVGRPRCGWLDTAYDFVAAVRRGVEGVAVRACGPLESRLPPCAQAMNIE